MHGPNQLRSALILLVVLTFPALSFTSTQSPKSGTVGPFSTSAPTFNLRSVGFEPLSNPAILSNGTYLTVNFVDEDHVLVTFKKSGLVKRMRTCPTSHADHFSRALIYELSTGKVITQTEWYLHDFRRYLWPLGGGRFLLRKGRQLYQLDAALDEKLLLESPREMTWVDVTPDAKQIIVETETDAAQTSNNKTNSQSRSNYEVRFLDADTLAPQRELQAREPMHLQATSTGYPDLARGLTGNVWLVRFGPDAKVRRPLARVKSLNTPTLLFPTANTIFIGRYSSLHSYSVSLFTVTGTRLWRQRWEYLRDVPWISRSEDGSRFAMSTVRRLPKQTRGSADNPDEDPQSNLEQIMDVFETATGNAVLSMKLAPAFIAGQNFSLSPDGSQLAIVRGSNIDFVRLAPPSAEEKAKYLAVKADVPGLYAPSDPEEEEPPAADDLTLTEAGITSDLTPAEQPSASLAAVNTSGSVPTFKSSSSVVVVDVVVLDSRNSPVSGLKREDFTVKEDGAPQQIRSFVEYGDTEKKTAATAPVQRPRNVFTNADERPPADAVTVLLYDSLNTPPSQQVYALQQLAQYLKTKPKDVRVALFTLTTSLRMITGFTEDESALLTAVQGKKKKVSGALVGRPESGPVGYDRVVAKLQDDFALKGGGALAETLKQHRQHQDEQDQATMDTRVQITLDAFAQLARFLSGIPGRKNLIWLSSSFPIWIAPNPDSIRPFSLTRTYGDQIKKAVHLLASAHVAVYPVDLRGLAVAKAFDVSVAGRGVQDFGDPDSASSDRATMRQVAEGTGGRAFTNTNGIKEAIQESVEQSAAFYTLSYTPTNGKYDGSFRRIRVEAAPRGYKLQYRTGYYADDPEKLGRNPDELSRELQVAALQPGAPDLRQIPFVARVVPVGDQFKADVNQFMPPTKRRKSSATKAEPAMITAQRYAIDYAIPAARLRFVPTPNGGLHGVFNFMLTAFNGSGEVVARAGNAANSNLPAERYKELLAAGYRMHQEIDVPTTATALRMAVQDATTGNLATLEIALPVPPPPDLPQRKGRKALPQVEPD